MDEVVSVRNEVSFFRTQHVELRKRFILDKISQQESDSYGIIVGDSIIEGMNTLESSDIPVINGGIGGARTLDVSQMLASVNVDAKARFLIVSVGVNDAVKTSGEIGEEEFEEFVEQLLFNAKRVADRVYISTIFPVEKGKPLGDQYFDQDRIDAINVILKKKPAEHGASLIESNRAFDDFSGSYTTDGVHPTIEAYDVLRTKITAALAKTL
jgi:lysophospholipase L1-like esterase